MTFICPPEHKHGETTTCYVNHGCRCDGCRENRQRGRGVQQFNTLLLRGHNVRVQALGAQRRLQALGAMGWSTRVLAERAGVHFRNFNKIRDGEFQRVGIRTHRLIHRLYRELALEHAPGRSGKMTRYTARREGWANALMWDDIDNPHETPRGAKMEPAL